MLGAERVGRQLLSLDQRTLRLEQVVEAADLREVDREHVVADEIAKCALHADALFVPGRVERNDAGVDVVQEHLEIRGTRMVEPGAGRRRDGTRDHNAADYSMNGASWRGGS